MNDRFKFRGVHPILSELQEIKFIDFIHNTVDFGDGDIFKIEEVNMQQCTGLKDKNGKLIYEGDIVKPLSEYPTFNGEIKFGKIDNYQSFYVDWHTKYPVLRGDLYFWLEDKDEGLEVIGNIYQDSHLLEKEKDI